MIIDSGRRTRHAVVVGAGMAGLLAGRVLAETYPRVTVLDRDSLPGVPAHRRGVPQGRHVHALQPRGQRLLERLFPGLRDELVDAGAVLGPMRFHLSGHRLAAPAGATPGLFATRPLLEHRVRERVAGLPGVAIVGGHPVDGLLVDAGRVAGVRSMGSPVEADLVVDAAGRGTRTPVWLAELGLPGPPVERVEVGLRYVTRTYRLRPDALGGDAAVLTAPTRRSGGAPCSPRSRADATS